ncbi:MAG: hypothetical protein KF760_23220 [Candidatus Eremiobacteraeota bacterium]|nr:hypothetical protein [Candidatus Eremiobacteraeota bacterium]MCW5870529.1 hypothetical protein [Candidatus Eremiobacteraeota bacterium]
MRGGFSLLELLLALGTLAVTLLLVVALGISVAGRNQQSLEAPVGLIAAQSVLSQFVYNVQASTDQGPFFSKPTTANYASDTVEIDRVTFHYQVDLEHLPTGGTSLGNTNRLMKITVKVFWQMGNGPQAGRHQSEMARLVHEDN